MLKKLFLEEVEKIVGDEKEVGIALSSGLDSVCVLFALLELKVPTTAYTFHIDGVQSQDYVYAKKIAMHFDVPFVEVSIPTKLNKDYVIEIIQKYGQKKKTDVECIYPFYYMLPLVTQKLVLTGAWSDGHFCISKKGMIHYRQTLEKIQKFRDEYFSNTAYNVDHTLNIISQEKYDIRFEAPYDKQNIKDYFYPLTWEDCNRPKQKQPLRDMFPEKLSQVKTFPHTSLQCGHSQIRELFEPILEDEKLNYKQRTRVIDVYRDIYNMTKQEDLFHAV